MDAPDRFTLVPPTSEVGSLQDRNLELNHDRESVENSEGSVQEDVEVNSWKRMFDLQHQQMFELVKTLKEMTPVRSIKIVLPEFNPDSTEDTDARAWCGTVDLCLKENPTQGSALIMALSKALKGTASSWFSQVTYAGMDWPQFKELFLARYDSVETPAAVIIRVNSGKPKQGECLSAYAGRLITLLTARWQSLTVEQIAVATVLAHCVQNEPQLQRLAYTTDINSRSALQQELMASAYRKRSAAVSLKDRDQNTNYSKRPKTNCYNCGKIGHTTADCWRRKKDDRTSGAGPSKNKPGNTQQRKHAVTCFKCGESGHISPQCKKNAKAEPSKVPAERHVNICTIASVTAELAQSGEQYLFCFDSGAECSLIKESVANKFSGKRIQSSVTLLGLGRSRVASNLQVLSQVIIKGYTIELMFHVVPDDYLGNDILIGRDLIAQGFTAEMSCDGFCLKRTKSVSVCEVGERVDNFDKIDTDVAGADRLRLIELLNEFSSSFVVGIPTGRIRTGEMQIKLIDPNRTVQRRPYRLSPDEREVLRHKIDGLSSAGIIRPSCSPFASPVLLVKKKDGSDRLCVDYRELNSNTVPDKYPLPLINDQIQRLSGAKYFTTLDMASGFHQLPIHEDSIERTAFVTPDGQFEYLTMPFGLRNAPSVFQRAINKALGELVNSFAVCYIDDVMIPADSVAQSLERLKMVLDKLRVAGFSLNLGKCSFLKSRVDYLGYEVSAGEIRPNPHKVKALTESSPPGTVTQLRQFIGLASYFRQFIPKFSQITAPLYKLTTGKGKIEWNPKSEQIRQQIITKLTSEPVLMIFNPTYPIELYTDASAEGYGAVLMQKVNNKSHVVAYYSKRTTNVESRYHSYELETMAVVNAVKHFHHFLQGRNFTVFTDCNALKASRSKVDLTPRVHRWWAFLQAYDFEIIYREGKRMGHADFLSRNPVETKPATNRVEQKRVNLAEISENWLQAEQQRDNELCDIISKLQNNELDTDIANTYQIRSGVLYRKVQRKNSSRYLPMVPVNFRWSVINNVHESIMHLGWEKTLEKVYQHYWFPKMSKYVRKFVENCITCKMSKSHSGKIQAELHPIPKISIPWHTIHIDATGKLSGKNNLKEYVFVFVDSFTKFVLLRHTLRIDARSAITTLKQCVNLFGAPSKVIADQGRCFANNDFREFCKTHSIDLHLIATGTSRANGQVERVMSTLKNMLTAVELSNDKSWRESLDEIQLALNCTVNRTTKHSPLELLIGRVARPLSLSVIDVQEEEEMDLSKIREQAIVSIGQNAVEDKERFDSGKAKVGRFSVGDFVLIENHERNQTKLDAKFRGPYRVVEVLPNDRYCLKVINGNRTYKYAHERLRLMPDSNVPMELDPCGGCSDDDQSECAGVGVDNSE